MSRLRFQLILLVCWLITVFSLSQISVFIDISSFAYFFVITVIISAFVVPHLSKFYLWFILALLTIIFMLVKFFSGMLGSITEIVLAVIEVSSVVITSLLTLWIINSIIQLENDVTQIKIGRHDKIADSALDGQGFIYREVRRARNHQRPFALIAVSVDEKSIQVDIDRSVKEVQLAMVKQYKLSGLSRILCDEVDDCAIIVQSDEHFLVALPEVKPEELQIIIERLRKKVYDQIGVQIKIGAATLPQDGYTFEGLADRATQEMKDNIETKTCTELDRVSSKHRVSISGSRYG